MKIHVALAAAALLLLAMTGRGVPNQQASLPPNTDPIDPLSEQAPELAELRVADLKEILAALDLSEATLTYHGETVNTCDAGLAIRGKSYLGKLQDFTWEEYHAPAEWDGSGEYRCVLTAPGVTLTAYQSGYANARPLRVETASGEGMFTLPYLEDEQTHGAAQISWMVFEVFTQWYQEARGADLYRGRAGTPLTAEELDRFEEYTASEKVTYDEDWGGYIGGATAISCFFTSQYGDPRDMDPREFLAYCPDQGTLEAGDEAEFRAVQEKLNWRGGEDGHLVTLEEMPVPCHRLPRSYINEILTKYAGITVEEMRVDWLNEGLYIPETDCFYTLTSDFGPGVFIPRYGEKSGDTVTLWEAPSGESGAADRLVLQKSGEDWHILSHQPC